MYVNRVHTKSKGNSPLCLQNACIEGVLIILGSVDKHTIIVSVFELHAGTGGNKNVCISDSGL